MATVTLYLWAINPKVSPDLTSWVILLEPTGMAEALDEALDEVFDEVFDVALDEAVVVGVLVVVWAAGACAE